MKISLEEERRALLEEIEARRSLYRHMLSSEGKQQQTGSTERQAIGLARPPRHNQLGKWLLDHPAQVAVGVTLLVWLGPRLIRRNQPRSKAVTRETAPGKHTGILKAVAGTMMLLLRDPRQLHTTASMVGNTWRWMRRETTNRIHPHGKKPYA
jgi:hypothetical protein